MSGKHKVFVLDTNVILHDSSCINQFKDNDILVPITVIEELDSFKKGNDSLSYHAREFVRTLDKLAANKLFNGGIQIGPGLGKVKVRFEQSYHPDMANLFQAKHADHAILNTAYCYSKENPDIQVIVVSKDVNLRMKAKAIGLMAEDYTTDHVKDVTELYRGYRVLENVPDELVNALYSSVVMVIKENHAAVLAILDKSDLRYEFMVRSRTQPMGVEESEMRVGNA